MGCNAFAPSHRVHQPDLPPKPLDDLAQAWRVIQRHAGYWVLDVSAVMGTSDGAHLAADGWAAQ